MDKNVPLERSITDRIMRRLRTIDGCWLFKVAGGAGQMRGVPDIVGCYQGKFFALEVKRPKVGRVTPLQLRRMEDIMRAGGVAAIVRSVEDALGVMDIIRHMEVVDDGADTD